MMMIMKSMDINMMLRILGVIINFYYQLKFAIEKLFSNIRQINKITLFIGLE